ncbi:unnamed protein product [Paramecium pentaurelia]|uniref:PX domain-containing protein n=1 Tax=Paramecium pentaurelia TaxID=43138 RepID=A0A8S1T929_9CILI|nr:unnamed protein product [Paramecium pentaurelia]
MESIILGIKQGDLKYFDDSIDLQTLIPYKIHTIKIFYTNQGILGIQNYYYSFSSQSVIKCKEHKSSKMFGVNEQKLVMDNSEYIISLTWYQNEIGINRLEIQTNKQQIQIGQKDGEKKEFKMEQNYQLGAIAGGYKQQLQFLEWQIIPIVEQQAQYQSQLYQLYLSQNEGNQQNTKFEYIGKQYRVCDPQIIQQGLTNKFVQFRIVDNTEQEVIRRFQDVLQLRQILQLRWPGVYIPPLMNKSTFEDYSNEHIENIRKAIEYFLMKLSKITYFAQSIEFNVFITKTNKDSNQEMEYVQNKLKEMTQQTSIDQIDLRYKQSFEEFETKESVNEQQRQKCNDFSILMSKLEQLKIGDFSDIKKLFEQHSKNVNYLSKYILPELHLIHLNLQSEEFIQRRKSNSIDRGLQMQIDTMNDVYDYFVTEQREANAMSQCMNYIKDLEQQKNKLEQKIMSQKLKQEELTIIKTQFQSISSIWSILIKSYANYFIDNYFKERYQLYLLMINRLAQIQLNNLKLRQHFWQSI